jgi:uncharacterized protein
MGQPGTPRTPREVFLALVNGIAQGNLDRLHDLYAEQIDVVHPFDPLHGAPFRSRDDVRKAMERVAAGSRPRRGPAARRSPGPPSATSP